MGNFYSKYGSDNSDNRDMSQNTVAGQDDAIVIGKGATAHVNKTSTTNTVGLGGTLLQNGATQTTVEDDGFLNTGTLTINNEFSDDVKAVILGQANALKGAVEKAQNFASEAIDKVTGNSTKNLNPILYTALGLGLLATVATIIKKKGK